MDSSVSRPEVIVGVLLHLITAYHGHGCPALAGCIARHFEYLAAHPAAHRILRDVAAASVAHWQAAALGDRGDANASTGRAQPFYSARTPGLLRSWTA